MAEIAVGIAISVAISLSTTLILSALQPPNEATRLADINPLKASYGEPVPTIFGQCRLSGIIFWARDLDEYVEDKVYKYRGACAVAFCRTSSGDNAQFKTVWGNKRLMYSDDSDSNKYNLGFWEGINTTRSDIMLNTEGATNVPFFKGLTYMVMRKAKLERFGFSLPNFEAVIKDRELGGTFPSLKTVLTRVCTMAGLESTEFKFLDSSFFENTTVFSAKLINDGSTYRKFIEELQVVYDFTMRDIGGRTEFIPTRPSSSSILISSKAMGCQPENQGTETGTSGDDTFNLFKQQEESAVDLPTEVQIEYYNRNNQFRKSSSSYVEAHYFDSNTKVITIPSVGLTNQEARDLAAKSFQYARNTRTSYSGMSAPYIQHNGNVTQQYTNPDLKGLIEPGSNYILPVLPLTLEQVIQKNEVSPSFIQSFSSVDYYLSSAVNQVITDPEGSNDVGPLFDEYDFTLIETSPLRSLTTLGGANPYDYASYHVTLNAGDPPSFSRNYYEEGTVAVEAGKSSDRTTKGVTNTVLPRTSHLFYDTTSVLRVTLDAPTMTLRNLTTAEWLNNQQVIHLGTGELILVQFAALVSPGVYDLSGFIRGWQGTENMRGIPTPTGTKVTLMYQESNSDAKGASFNSVTPNLPINTVTDFYSLDEEVSVDDFIPTLDQSILFKKDSLKPFAPVIDTYDPATGKLTWIRRTRGYFSDNLNNVPLNENGESYTIEFTTTTAVVLTLNLSDATEYTLSPAQLTTVTSGGTINMRIYQNSSIFGQGHIGRYSANATTGVITYTG